MSTDKSKGIGTGVSGSTTSNAEVTALEGAGVTLLGPRETEGEGLLVESNRFVPSSKAPITALAARVVHHPVLSPAKLLALVGVSEKAAELFFEEALASELTGNRPEALRLYQRAISAWNSSFSGDKNRRIAETDERMATLESDPSRRSDDETRAAIHWTRYAKGLLDKGKSGKAMDVLKKAITFSQKAGAHLDRAQRNTLHALFFQARAAWLAEKGEPESYDDPVRLREAARLIEQITQKSRQGKDPAQLVSQAMDLAAEMVPELTRYAGRAIEGSMEHKWVNFGGMETKLDTAIFIFEAVEELVVDPDDQRKIVTAYRMRAGLHREMQLGDNAAVDEAKADELELRWGLALEQRARLIGVTDATTAVTSEPPAILPAISALDHAEHSSPLRDLFLQARLLSRLEKRREASEIYFYLARQAEERGDLSSALELYRMIDIYALNDPTKASLYEKMAQLLPDSPERASYFERAATAWWSSRTLSGGRRAVDLIQGPARSVVDGESRMAICRDFLTSFGRALSDIDEVKGSWERTDFSHVLNVPDVMEIGAQLVSQAADMKEPDHALLLLDGALALYFRFEGKIFEKDDQRQVSAAYRLRAALRRSQGLSDLAEQDERNAAWLNKRSGLDEEWSTDDLMRAATLAHTKAQALKPEEERWIPFIGTDGHALPQRTGRRAHGRELDHILFPSVWDLVHSPSLFKDTPSSPEMDEEERFRRYVRALGGFYNRYVWPADPLTLVVPESGSKPLDEILYDPYRPFGESHPNQKEALARLLAAHHLHAMGVSRTARDFLETQRAYFSGALPTSVWTLPALTRLVRQKLSSHGAGFGDISNVPLNSRLVDLGVSEFGYPDQLFYYLDDLRKSLETAFPSGIKQENSLQDVIRAFADQLSNPHRQPNDLDPFRARALTLAVEAMDEKLGGGQGPGGGSAPSSNDPGPSKIRDPEEGDALATTDDETAEEGADEEAVSDESGILSTGLGGAPIGALGVGPARRSFSVGGAFEMARAPMLARALAR